MLKATREQTKTHNTELVLKTIYDQNTISRADIARLTHLTRPTVSTIVSRLIDDQYVMEIGQGPSAGGKRPTLLQVDNDSHQLVCVDLGSAEFNGATVNLRGEIGERVSFAVNGHRQEAALQLVYELIDTLLSKATAPVLGIGIGTPGLVNSVQGVIENAVNLEWSELPIRQLLAAHYQKPIYVVNDSHAAAFAEYTFGEPHDSQNLLVVKVGQGVGAGIVLNGQLYYGDGFGAGEIGHVVVVENGELCTCGNFGCLETVVSRPAIMQKARLLAAQHPTSALGQLAGISWEAVVATYHQGDPVVQGLVLEVGRYLGVALANLVGSLNIHHIVIVGRLAAFGEGLLTAVCQSVSQHALPSMARATHITFSSLQSDTVILGCAAIILKHELGII